MGDTVKVNVDDSAIGQPEDTAARGMVRTYHVKNEYVNSLIR